MHIAPTTHEHGATGKVYTYEGRFDVDDDSIVWKASVSQGGEQERSFAGTIPLTSPAVVALAEQAVRDDIVKCIDTFDDNPEAELLTRKSESLAR